MTPGSNILKKALRKLGKTKGIYYKYSDRVLNKVGNWAPGYLSGVEIVGSLQPLDRSVYYIYGYDLQKQYFEFFCSNNVIDLKRDRAPDQMAFDGVLYSCSSIKAWYRIDGWVRVHLISIGPDTRANDIFGFGSDDSNNGNQNFQNGTLASDEGS